MKINKNSEAQNYIESELKHKLLDISACTYLQMLERKCRQQDTSHGKS
jgi:hypothetical protein